MRCTKTNETRKYLCAFYQILNTMENKMLSAPITDNITINFITAMVPHHQSAIYMCQNLLRFTDYELLKNIAENIISIQTRGIGHMREIAITSYGYSNTRRDISLYERAYFSITRNMLCRMRNAPISNNINLNFIDEMIPHHEGAIRMCENVLKYKIDPRLVDIANSIIVEQTNEVKELKEIKENLYNN